MISCSEYVSLGHPDKTADYISAFLLDEYLKHDPSTRFAIEVQLKDHICNLAGEITSEWHPSNEELETLVQQAIREVGYTSDYAARWPQGTTLNADNVQVNVFIGRQSPNIAQGVDKDGWGDQGVFAGMATKHSTYQYMPQDIYFAQTIGKRLYGLATDNILPLGLDIKLLVEATEKNYIERIVVAAPMQEQDISLCKVGIGDVIHDVLSEKGYKCGEVIINGTGAYVVHSTVGDSGVVGRKLAVDFYGLNCPIGGGSPWGKDPTKADVSLNIYARYLALKCMKENKNLYSQVFAKIGCCIGQKKCSVTLTDAYNRRIRSNTLDISPQEVISFLGLSGRESNHTFTHLCKEGLFVGCDALI